MKFTKVLPYKLRLALPMLGFAGATMVMSGCSKDDHVEPRQEPHVVEPSKKITCEFVWGISDISQIWSDEKQRATDKLLAAADSADVVVLRVDGKYWHRLYNERELLDAYLNPVMYSIPEKNRSKFTGAGTIWGVRQEDPAARKELEEKWRFKMHYGSSTNPPQNQR